MLQYIQLSAILKYNVLSNDTHRWPPGLSHCLWQVDDIVVFGPSCGWLRFLHDGPLLQYMTGMKVSRSRQKECVSCVSVTKIN